MEWLIAYGVGAVLMLVTCGVAIGQTKNIRGDLLTATFLALFWPIVLPFVVGVALRGDR